MKHGRVIDFTPLAIRLKIAWKPHKAYGRSEKVGRNDYGFHRDVSIPF